MLSIIDLLQEEIIIEIMIVMNFESLFYLSTCSSYFNNLTKNKIFINKLSHNFPNDTYISDFTLKEL